MITHCEECNTYFRVSIEQLNAANGQVKCGCCMAVFDALPSLVEQSDPEADPNPKMGREIYQKNRQSQPQSEPQPKNRFREQSAPPASQQPTPADEETSVWDNFKFRRNGKSHEPVEGEFSSVDHLENDTVSSDEFLSLDIEFSIPEDSIYNTPVVQHHYATPLWIGTCMLMLCLLFFQYFQFNTVQELTYADPNHPFCAFLDCTENTPLADTSMISLLSRDIREHPQLSDVLLVNLTLVNTAINKQPFPQLQLDLFDNAGRAIGSRRFNPNEYLDDSIDQTSMKPEHPVHIVLEIVSTGATASSFEFTFL